MSVQDIFNFIEIDDLTATAGQPSVEQFAEVRDAGYELVVNLAPDGLTRSLPDEAGLLRALGLDYRQIPVTWNDPRPEQLDAFIALMDEGAGRRTLIHCQANMRVTAFYSLYAMARLGWDRPRAQALRDSIWTRHPGYTMDETWAAFITEAERRIVG